MLPFGGHLSKLEQGLVAANKRIAELEERIDDQAQIFVKCSDLKEQLR